MKYKLGMALVMHRSQRIARVVREGFHAARLSVMHEARNRRLNARSLGG